jgi:hypothetical protein
MDKINEELVDLISDFYQYAQDGDDVEKLKEEAFKTSSIK